MARLCTGWSKACIHVLVAGGAGACMHACMHAWMHAQKACMYMCHVHARTMHDDACTRTCIDASTHGFASASVCERAWVGVCVRAAHALVAAPLTADSTLLYIMHVCVACSTRGPRIPLMRACAVELFAILPAKLHRRSPLIPIPCGVSFCPANLTDALKCFSPFQSIHMYPRRPPHPPDIVRLVTSTHPSLSAAAPCWRCL
eukprot:353424-Chlamydomonas_euryale.AAC.5